MSSILTAVAGGIVGAGLTAIANYKIQTRLASERRRENEEKQSYIRFVQITEIVAMFDSIREISKALMGEEVNAFIQGLEEKPEDERYDFWHGLSAWFSITANNNLKRGKVNNELEMYRVVLGPSLDRVFGFKMSVSELAELPNDVIVAYSNFSKATVHMPSSIDLLLKAISEGQPSVLTTKFFYSFVISFIEIYQNAKKLHEAVTKECGVTDGEAKQLYFEYYKETYDRFKNGIESNAKLALAEVDVAKDLEKSKATESPKPKGRR